MSKKTLSKSEPRNLGVMVLAGVGAVLAIMFATNEYDSSPLSAVYKIASWVLAAFFLVVALVGRLRPLKQFMKELFRNWPF